MPAVASSWSPPAEMPVPRWKIDECAQAARALHIFMQEKPHLQLAVECFDHHERLRLTCAVMNVIGQELNLEETLSKEGTFESIMSALSLNEEPQGMLDEFHIEGEHGKSGNWRRMVWQSALAMDLLFKSAQLSTAVLIKAHETMTHGAQGTGEEFGEGVPSTLRTTHAFAGDYQFPPPAQLREAVEAMVQRFSDAVSNPGKHPVIVAIDLMFEFVTIHPFVSGNGRMCRMLFTYAMKQQGCPLLVFLQPLTHSKNARAEYFEAIRHAQQQESKTSRHPMYAMGFNSVGAALKSATAYFDWAAAASAPYSFGYTKSPSKKARKKQSQKQRRAAAGGQAKPHSHEALAENEPRAPADLFESDEHDAEMHALAALVESSQIL